MKKICVVLSMCMMFVLGACCVQEVGAEQDKIVFYQFPKASNHRKIYVVVDEYTGVNYLIYDGIKAGGMCPRYNADGSLYVTGGK